MNGQGDFQNIDVLDVSDNLTNINRLKKINQHQQDTSTSTRAAPRADSAGGGQTPNALKDRRTQKDKPPSAVKGGPGG